MKNQKEFSVQDVAIIQKHIILVRNVPAILDRDLAAMYGVEVKQLNRQVKRNIERFPPDFMFQLTKDECTRCQIGTLYERGGKTLSWSTYQPYVFGLKGSDPSVYVLLYMLDFGAADVVDYAAS